MTSKAEYLQKYILKGTGYSISTIISDNECTGYSGCSFTAGDIRFIFRKAKITPKKNGQFVTLWKRNISSKKTEPFNGEDPFDFCIIITEWHNLFGFFLFPKTILCENKIITTPSATGKMAFRVYPVWDNPGSLQAEKTQRWQTAFFISFSDKDRYEKLKTILIDFNRDKSLNIFL